MKGDLLANIYDAYHKELSLYVYSICRDHGMTEDIVHDAFVKAILSLSEKHENFRAWLYLVARNLCFNEMKKRGRTLLLAPEDFPENVQSGDAPAESVTDTEPLAAYLTKEQNGELYEKIMTLPGQYRQVVVLRWFSGLPFDRIAEIMGIRTENARVIAHRAKERIR
jgi:RNA polymerase sigma-70 factor (ECF subfamily)